MNCFQKIKKGLGLFAVTAVVGMASVLPASATGLAAITMDVTEMNAFAPKVVTFVVALVIVGAIIKLCKKGA